MSSRFTSFFFSFRLLLPFTLSVTADRLAVCHCLVELLSGVPKNIPLSHRNDHMTKKQSCILIEHNKTNNIRGRFLWDTGTFFGTPDIYLCRFPSRLSSVSIHLYSCLSMPSWTSIHHYHCLSVSIHLLYVSPIQEECLSICHCLLVFKLLSTRISDCLFLT